MAQPYSVQVENLKFGYPDSNKELLDIPELKLPKGSHLFIEGASGSGKSITISFYIIIEIVVRIEIRITRLLL